MKKIVLYTSIGIIVDQALKILVESFFYINQSITVIDSFFFLTYVRNYGAAFSILNGNRLFFIIIAIIALLVFYLFFLKEKKLNKKEKIVYSLFLSGILGNLIDRIFRGYVVDYLSFIIITYAYPIFNFADICIVLSTIYMIGKMGKE